MDFNLNFNISFEDLYNIDGLYKLDQIFLNYLSNENKKIYQDLMAARDICKITNSLADESETIISVASYLEKFISELFDLNQEISDYQTRVSKLSNIYKCKRLFVQRKAIKKYSLEDTKSFNIIDIESFITQKIKQFSEVNFADYVTQLLADEKSHELELDYFIKYSAWSVLNPIGQNKHKESVLFRIPEKIDYANLVKTKTKKNGAHICHISEHQVKSREGFSLTDNGPNLDKILGEANYCIFCHKREKDSCSKGIKTKEDSYKISDLNTVLTGCPLEEKISEMNLLTQQGLVISSLATAMIDNPLLAATGHRICNDCMKSCIYQAQDPVNIPEIESKNLKTVLDFPYGFEIYSLFTRWNPLNFRRYLPRKDTNYKILVVGVGPAGFNLAYHLLQEGHTVVAIDGLKIEPLDEELIKNNFIPIENTNHKIFDDLNHRIPQGFGGVAEYGITVRWNKNYLNVIRIILQRHKNFRLYGGTRFGSQINKKIAFEQLGFDHIALCMGAGSPTIVPLKNNLSKGIRKASDFLMNLQLAGAFKKDSIANLQIRLPAIVVGGRLTAIDTATEILAYYPVQIEKFYQRYKIVNSLDEFDPEEQEIAKEFLEHARELECEKKLAQDENRKPNIIKLLYKWGGVKILYRKSLQDSPAYRLNHEEVYKALEEGVMFVPNITVQEAILDKYGYVCAVKCDNGKIITVKSILIAAGTKPNTILATEDNDFQLDNLYLKLLDIDGNAKQPYNISKPDETNIITYIEKKNRAISFFGDMHPDFSGNVVKAMASSKKGYPIISKILKKLPKNNRSNNKLFHELDYLLKAKIIQINRLTPNIVEITVQAPLAARNFKPGQFYRLQNYNKFVSKQDGVDLTMEGLALTGASVSGDNISLIVLEMGGSSNLCKNFKPSDEIILMGPTGEATEILKNKTILLAGGGLGNAVLFSIGKAYKEAGSRVLYFAAYKKLQDRYKIKEIEDASDMVIWVCEEEGKLQLNRKQDLTFTGNIIEAMRSYADGSLGEGLISILEIDHIIAIGSMGMMNAVKKFKDKISYLKKKPTAIASINSPMQCMMKEICAACLQKHIDPKTKKEYFVYSCFNQDQNMDTVSFSHLEQRLKQNSTQEKLTKLWLQNLSS